MVKKIRGGKGKKTNFGEVYKKHVKLNVIESVTGSSHSYSDE